MRVLWMTTSQVRIDAVDGFLGGLGLGAAHVRVRVEDLPLQIGKIHGVEIHDADLADAGGGEIHGDGRAEAARADAQDAGGLDFLLAGQTDFGQNQMPRVAADFVIVQFHKSKGKYSNAAAKEIKSGSLNKFYCSALSRNCNRPSSFIRNKAAVVLPIADKPEISPSRFLKCSSQSSSRG